MNKAEHDIRLRLKADFLHYAEKCLKIRTKPGAIKPLTLNAAQLFIHDRLEEQLRTAKKVRALIVKGRQQGCSTYVEARFYWKVTHSAGLRAFILTHLDEATRNLFQIMKRFHESCPYPVKAHTGRANSREMIFDRLDSGYNVGTAKSQGVGRSHTLQYFHGSEVAYWSNAFEHMSGVLQAVPDMDGTEIILESTSAGAQGLFYKLCDDARHNRSEYQLIFVPWFLQPEYRKNPPTDFELTLEEKDYQKAFNLDEAQMYWRRTKVHELGNIWTFRREYPATIDEAFYTDRPGALWTRETLQINRVEVEELPEMKRIVVAIDPAITSNKTPKAIELSTIAVAVESGAHRYERSTKICPIAHKSPIASRVGSILLSNEIHRPRRIKSDNPRLARFVVHVIVSGLQLVAAFFRVA